jgi:hypothetical protein
MYAAPVSDASSHVLLMVLIAWIFTLAAVTVVVLFVARWALTKADSKDVPEVLTGLAHLLLAASWPKDLTGLLGRGSVAGASPRPAMLDAGPAIGDALPAGGHNDDVSETGGQR